MSIGTRIKEARINKGFTQKELSERVGVTKGAIANYENDLSSPKDSVLYALFDVLQVDPNYLFQDVCKAIKNAPSEKDEALLNMFHKLNDEGKEQLLDFADSLVKSGKFGEKDSKAKVV